MHRQERGDIDVKIYESLGLVLAFVEDEVLLNTPLGLLFSGLVYLRCSTEGRLLIRAGACTLH